jgi:hypothetical protein
MLHRVRSLKYEESAIVVVSRPTGTRLRRWHRKCDVPSVPEIARFHGITITMYHREHGAPHFHAVWGGRRISVDIETGTIRGAFPRRAQRLVLAWLSHNRQELMSNWELAQRRKPLRPIPPLE